MSLSSKRRHRKCYSSSLINNRKLA